MKKVLSFAFSVMVASAICAQPLKSGLVGQPQSASKRTTVMQQQVTKMAALNLEKKNFGTPVRVESLKNQSRIAAAPEVTAPEVVFEPDGTLLNVATDYRGYGYQVGFSMIPAYAPVSYKNLTVDNADTWAWKISTTEGKETTSSERDFTFEPVPDEYTPAELVGSYKGSASAPFTWGVGVENEEAYMYAGASQSFFSDDAAGFYPMMTRANLDLALARHSGLATPGNNSQGLELTSLLLYQGKPFSPLYFEGVNMFFYAGDFQAKDGFTMKCKLIKVTRDAEGKIAYGDVIAESDATIENVKIDWVAEVEWTDFYVTDEIGMSESIDYLMIEDEFAIVIEGWNNGTFEATPFVEYYDYSETVGTTNTFFTMVQNGEESLYAYNNSFYNAYVGFVGAVYGYLHTTDNTDLTMPNEGGEATIHVEPMYYSRDENGQPTYRLFVEDIVVDGESVEEFPEWLTFSIANENYDEGTDYDLIVTVDALGDVESRQATVTFMQEGARLKVNVTQGAGGGNGGDDEPKPYIAWVYTEGYGAYSYAFATDPVVKALQEDYNVVDVNIDADTNPTSDEKLNSTLLNADVVVVCEAMTGNKTMSNSLVNYVGQVPVIALKAYNYNDGRWSWGSPANPSPAALGFTANTTYKVLDGVTYEEDGTIKVATETASNAIQTVTFGAGAPEDMVIMGTVGEGAAMYASNAQKFFGLGLSSDCWSYYTENPGIIVKNAVAMLIAGEDLTTVNETESINTVITQGENGAVYNLQGQRVLKAQKGLYIVNGKKFIVK